MRVRQLKYIDIDIDILDRKIKALDISLKGVKLKEKVQGGIYDFDGEILESIEKKEKYLKEKNRLIKQKNIIIKAVENYPKPKARQIFNYRLILGYTFEKISGCMEMSETQIRRVFNEDIKILAETAEMAERSVLYCKV